MLKCHTSMKDNTFFIFGLMALVAIVGLVITFRESDSVNIDQTSALGTLTLQRSSDEPAGSLIIVNDEGTNLQYILGEVIVSFYRNIDDVKAREIISKIDGEVGQWFEEVPVYLVLVQDEDGSGIKQAISKLMSYNEVERATPNYIVAKKE